MITIEKILTNENTNFKVIDIEDNYKILKIENRLNLLQLTSKNDVFLLDRDLFDYLDANKLSYVLLLLNEQKKQWYLLQLKKENNWIKSCFATCDKQKIFLGKQVLNSNIKEEEINKKIQRIT